MFDLQRECIEPKLPEVACLRNKQLIPRCDTSRKKRWGIFRGFSFYIKIAFSRGSVVAPVHSPRNWRNVVLRYRASKWNMYGISPTVCIYSNRNARCRDGYVYRALPVKLILPFLLFSRRVPGTVTNTAFPSTP